MVELIMGLGGETSKSHELLDMVDGAIILNPTTKTEEYLNAIYTFIRDHRDALGLQKGKNSFPYLYVSNDLFGKFTGLVQLIGQHPDVKTVLQQPANADLFYRLATLLVATYGEENHEKGCSGSSSCCGFYHSQPISVAQEILEKIPKP